MDVKIIFKILSVATVQLHFIRLNCNFHAWSCGSKLQINMRKIGTFWVKGSRTGKLILSSFVLQIYPIVWGHFFLTFPSLSSWFPFIFSLQLIKFWKNLNFTRERMEEVHLLFFSFCFYHGLASSLLSYYACYCFKLKSTS